jgi:V/A-type H+-transporting ATPase subunit A
LISWSKYIEEVSKELDKRIEGWGRMVKKARDVLFEGYEIGKRMEVVGEEGTAINDMIAYLKSELYDFSYLQQNSFDKEDAYCPLDRQIPLFQLINKIFDKDFVFATQDEARKYFLQLQNQIKNMNFLPFNSEHYRNAFAAIEHVIDSAKHA